MHKFKISKVRDAETERKFTFRIRDLYEKYTFEATAKAKDVLEAKQKIKSKLIGWGNMHIMSVKDDQGRSYYGRDLITFKDNKTVETEVEDDRLSPMTYAKLKEMGYNHEDWKDLSQEQANKIVHEETSNQNSSLLNKSENSKEHINKLEKQIKQLHEKRKNASTYEEYDKYDAEINKLSNEINKAINEQGYEQRYISQPDKTKQSEEIAFVDNNTVVKDWSGSYNGAYYDYSNGVWTITHKNGKVEKFPDEKFNATSEIKAYIDSFKDAGIAYIITTKKQDKFFDGKQLNTELKQAKKFDTKEKGIQAAEEAFGSNWENNLDVITVNSDLSAYASLVRDSDSDFTYKGLDIRKRGNDYFVYKNNKLLFSYGSDESASSIKRDIDKEIKKGTIRDATFTEELNYKGIKITHKRGLGWENYIVHTDTGNWSYQSLEAAKNDIDTKNKVLFNDGLNVKELEYFAKQKGLSYVDAKRMLEEDNDEPNYGESAMWKAMHDASIEVTQESGTDKILYVMQSNADKNLYFYVGKTYSMKDGEWTYAKYKMNGVSPETLKKDLEANGWHQVSNGPARVIDSIKDSWADDAMKELNKKGKANWTEDDWETYHYIEQARHESGYYEDSAIKDMALSRTNAMDRCISLGKQFIQHFDKMYKEPTNSAIEHWLAKMENLYGSVKQIKLKQNNSSLFTGELRDWFFTAGANATDFMKGADRKEEEVYDKFVNDIISKNSVREAYKNLASHIQDAEKDPSLFTYTNAQLKRIMQTSSNTKEREIAKNELIARGVKVEDEETPIDYEGKEADDIIRRGTVEEYSAIQAYEPMIMRLKELYNETQNEKYLKAAQDLEEINNEEKKHIGEFAKISAELDPEQSELVQEGMNEVDSATVKDASVPSVKHTAEYLWTWVDKAHSVADQMFDEQADKYRSAEERMENLNPIFNASMKQLNDYEKALKAELDRMFNEGSALNRQRIKEIYDRLSAKKR